MRAHDLLTLAVLISGVAGCSMDGTHPRGSYTFDCSGYGKGFDDCEAKAATQCEKGGYDVVSRTGDSVNNEMKRTMVVSCR